MSDRFLVDIIDSPELIQNVSIIGHHHHYKVSVTCQYVHVYMFCLLISFYLIEQTHPNVFVGGNKNMSCIIILIIKGVHLIVIS